MKRFWISLVAAGLLAVAAVAPVAAEEHELTIDLAEVDGSGISGTATLTDEDGTTMVDIQLDGTPEDGVHPVHIHAGTCDDLGDVVYPLEDIEGGASESTVDAPLDDILADDHAINAHLSADDMGVYIACGDIVMADEEDDAAVDEEDDAVGEDDEEVVTDDEDEDMVDEEDDAAADDEDEAAVDEEDDAEDVVPATGSVDGFGPEAGILMLTLAAGAIAGAGLLIRRRALKF